MFGGAGLYCDGMMFGLIADDVAYLPSALRLRLEEKADDSPSAVSRSGRSNRNREDFIKARPTEASGGRTGSSPFNPYPDKVKTAVMSYLATAWPSPRRVMKFLRMSSRKGCCALRIQMSWPDGRNVLWPSHERKSSSILM
jgi:TfoX/Sxy family transcriptional regulator of competence genes